MVGEQPWWYRLIRAGRVLGVPPWELLDRSEFWVQAALATQEAEVAARNRAESRAGKGLKGGHSRH